MRFKFLLPFLVFSCLLSAEEFELKNPSRIDIRTSYYEDGSVEYGVVIDKQLRGKERFQTEISWTDYDLILDTVQMNRLVFSLRGDPMQKRSLAGEIGYWGNDDIMTTMHGKFSMLAWTDPIEWSLHATFRQITFYGPNVNRSPQSPTFNLKSSKDVDNIGLYGSMTYLASRIWSHRLMGGFQSYSEDLQKYQEETAEFYINLLTWLALQSQNTDSLRQLLQIKLLTQLTLLSYAGLTDQVSTSSGFEDYSLNYELGMDFKKFSLGLNTGYGKSAMTGDDFNSVSLSTMYSGKSIQSGLTVGHIFTDQRFSSSDWVVQAYLSIALK